MDTACPICNESVDQNCARVMLIGDRLRYFHDPCYAIFAERIEQLWHILVGPDDVFQAWLEKKHHE